MTYASDAFTACAGAVLTIEDGRRIAWSRTNLFALKRVNEDRWASVVLGQPLDALRLMRDDFYTEDR